MQNPGRAISLQLPHKLAFGAGCLAMATEWIAAADPASVFVVSSPPVRALGESLHAALRAQGRKVTVWDAIVQEPLAEDLEQGMEAAREARADFIVGFGGGSVMDVAKLIAALLDGRQRISEVFGIGNLRGRSTPLVCVPTTSGTGSEVSPIAIVQDRADGLKKAVISPFLVPDAAFVDPALAVGMPPAVTAATGLDALTHCIEAYANRQAHPLVDTWALEGIRRISRGLARAYRDGSDLAARTDVSLGSLYGGMCLGPVNTAAVHALAYPLGSDYNVAHGVSNAVLLAHVLEFNVGAAPQRYADIAMAMGVEGEGPAEHIAAQGVERIRAINNEVAIPAHIAEFGVPASAIDRLAESAMTVQRLLAQNPRTVTLQDARDIYRRAF